MNADLGAVADRRHGLRLGEDLGVRTDPDLEILRPGALGDEVLLEPERPPSVPGCTARRSAPTTLLDPARGWQRRARGRP